MDRNAEMATIWYTKCFWSNTLRSLFFLFKFPKLKNLLKERPV